MPIITTAPGVRSSNAGTSGQVLTANAAGVLPSFQAAAAGGDSNRVNITDIWGDVADYETAFVASGAVTLDIQGLSITTGSTTTSSSHIYKRHYADTSNIFVRNPSFFIGGAVSGVPTTGESWFGFEEVTVAGTGLTFTTRQLGFKSVYATSVDVTSATNANGTTETATDISASVNIEVRNDYYARYTVGTDIVFYVDGVSLATHTTNMPTSASQGRIFAVAVSNKSTATTFTWILGAWVRQFDAL